MHFSVTGAKKISSLCPANVKAVLPGMQQVEVPMTFKSGQMFMKILSPPFFGIIWHQKKETAQTAQLEFGYQKNTPTKKHKKHTPKVSPSKIKNTLAFPISVVVISFRCWKSSDVFSPKRVAKSRRATCFSGHIAWRCLRDENANPEARGEKHTFRRETFRRKPHTENTEKAEKKNKTTLKKKCASPFMRNEFRRCLERRMGAMKVPGPTAEFSLPKWQLDPRSFKSLPDKTLPSLARTRPT